MEKTEKIDIRQREHLIDVVRSARNRKEDTLKQQTGVSEAGIIQELAKSKGALAVVDQMNDLDNQIYKLKAKLAAQQEELHELGFEHRNLQLALRWDCPKELTHALNKKLEAAYKPIEKELKHFDLAIAKVWTASSHDALLKAVEGLI